MTPHALSEIKARADEIASCRRIIDNENDNYTDVARARDREWKAKDQIAADIPALLALVAELLDAVYTMRDVLSADNWSCDPRDVASSASSPYDTPEWREAAKALRPPQEPPR